MSNRLRNLKIAPSLLGLLFRSPVIYYELDPPLPRDARVVDSFKEDLTGLFSIIVESAEFDEVKPGDIIPTYADIRFTALHSLVSEEKCSKN